MKGVVVYHSIWGSCRKIAEAITKGLKDSGHEVQALAVEDAEDPDPSLDFIVVGGATRWPGATRKIKRYAKKAAKAGLEGEPFATFSTGGTIFTEKPNTQASELLYEILEKGGLVALAPPFKAGIEDYKSGGRDKGSLPESEVARAEDFGRELGVKLSGG
jgi:menaquinone-dependent protoporphyrinogen IX oxidase